MSSYQTIPASGAGPVPTASSLGAQDAASKSGFYLVEDFNQVYVAPPGSPQISAFVQNSSFAGCGNGGVVFPAAELAQHPGIAFAKSSSLGWCHLSAANGTIPLNVNSAVTTSWNIVFRSPDSVSNGTDSFQFCAGCSVAGAYAYPGTGAGLSYRDTVNGGNWQTYTVYTPNEAPNYANTAIPFVPGAWNVLTMSHTGNSFTFNLNGTALGTTTNANLTASVVWQVSAGTLYYQRNLVGGTPAQVTALIDRASVYVSGLTR